jgi:hypothetical protein
MSLATLINPRRTTRKRTFSPTIELDIDLLVDILGQVENVFLLGLLLGLAGLLLRTAAATASATSTTSAAAPAAATKMTSLGHLLFTLVWFDGETNRLHEFEEAAISKWLVPKSALWSIEKSEPDQSELADKILRLVGFVRAVWAVWSELDQAERCA